MLNSPPTPRVLPILKERIKALGEVILQYPVSLLFVSDVIYEHTLWSYSPFVNIVNACPELYDRTVVVNGVSKSYAMTGWRIGYAAGPVKIIAAMKKAQSQSTSNPASISQYAAQAALEGGSECTIPMRKAYKERHDYLVAELKRMNGIKCLPSDGTFYAFPSIEALLNQDPSVTNDIEFADFLLSHAEVAVVPGSAFGAPGFIRMSYATSMENVVTAVERMKKALASFK